MTVEEAEEVFGARWNRWSEGQQKEFVGALTSEDPITPLVLTLCITHPFSVSEEFSLRLDDISPGWLAKAVLKMIQDGKLVEEAAQEALDKYL